MRTWCRDRNLDYLWPKQWLPHDLPSARIVTFGYNANFSSRKQQDSLSIGDFANDLLFQMKYGESGGRRLGEVPIIVIGHSMGGLIFKKAFIQGHANNDFRNIMAQIKAVLFIATPHRGTDLADTLNKVLTSSVFGHAPKYYVSELARTSPTIDDINEAFRHRVAQLKVFSFYETLNTQVGPLSVQILEKNVSWMGYPDETVQPLLADHHTACKYTDREDPNYKSVLGALRSVIDCLDVASFEEPNDDMETELEYLKALLGVSDVPEEDLAAGQAARKPGTCSGFLDHDQVKNWVNSDSSQILWVHAPPGSGKSVLSSFMVDHLLDQCNFCVAYFFFKHNHRQKRSAANMLRSLAFQMAASIPAFRHALVEMAKSGVKLGNAHFRSVWKRVYDQKLAKLKILDDCQIFWVVDGIDESESSMDVIEALSSIHGLDNSIRILAFSRPLPAINQAFQQARNQLPVFEFELTADHDDIRIVVSREMEYVPSSQELRTRTVDEITSRARGNFLWASLVLQRVAKCHRQEQVRRLLDSTPDGMVDLYDRMLDLVENPEMEEDRSLAKIIMSWAMYAKSPLTVAQLSEAYPSEFKEVLDLRNTITQLCGQFVVVSRNTQLTLVHYSAREYLQNTSRFPFSLDIGEVNEMLLMQCLEFLCDRGLRRKLNTAKDTPKFL